jgi:hypothetical protein
MSWHRAKATFTERGQVLVMSALVMLVLMAAIGLAIDLGRIFVARAQLVRSLDAAALAGTLELPNVPAAQAKVYQYMTANDPDAEVDVPVSPQERQIQVNGHKQVPMFFIKIFGVESVEVNASARAGFGVLAVDTVLAIDATGSMGDSPCNSHHNNSGCPIYEAKNAAMDFTDALLTDTISSSETLVGAIAYRGCYDPPRDYSACVPTATMVTDLSNDKSLLMSRIGNIDSLGGTGTNNCLGLLKANEVLFGPDHHTVSNSLHIVVLLSDGDNTYNASSYSASEGSPAAQCLPDYDPAHSDTYTDTSCRAAQTRERQLDTKTKALVDTMKANGVEVYVVGLGVCGTNNVHQYATTSYCSGIGNTNDDNTADRRLLKCIASSTPGTNDHYFEVQTASDLPDTFAKIARLIGFRLIQ